METVESIQQQILHKQQEIEAIAESIDEESIEHVKNVLKKALIEAEEELAALEQELKLASQVKGTKATFLEVIESGEFDQAIEKHNIGYLANEDCFIYCTDNGLTQQNVQFDMVKSAHAPRLFNQLLGQTLGANKNDLIDYFESRRLNFRKMTASFNNAKWNSNNIYNKIAVIRKYWVEPDPSQGTEQEEYDIAMLDFVLTNVCDNRQENIEHLERWIVFKYLHPEKVASTPNIDMGGQPGGNGKGILMLLLTTIFTPTCVIEAHASELNGQFNSAWEMATILYYDEPKDRELDSAKLKNTTGGQTVRIERKGIDAIQADRNYNFLFLSNNTRGVVSLSGGGDGGEDRRYSVINTSRVLLEELMNLTQVGATEAKIELDRIANQVVKNRAVVARWLHRLIAKHTERPFYSLGALHGRDYQERFETQKDEMTELFDELLPSVETQGFILLDYLYEIAMARLNDRVKPKKKEIAAYFKSYLKRARVDFIEQDRISVKLFWEGRDTTERKQGKVIALADMVNSQRQGSAQWCYDTDAHFTKNPVELAKSLSLDKNLSNHVRDEFKDSMTLRKISSGFVKQNHEKVKST